MHVENSKHAVEAVERSDYDLILMDIQMLVMNGIEATKIIRQSHDKNCLPIIAITANVLKNDVEQYIQIVINDHINNPFNQHDLLTLQKRHCKEPIQYKAKS